MFCFERNFDKQISDAGRKKFKQEKWEKTWFRD